LRRAILVFLLAVCVFGVAAVAGFYAASRMAPERLRSEAESRLSALLKAPVRLAEVRVSLTADLPWLRLEAHGLRADPLPGGRSLAVERLSARVDPVLLVLGRLRLRGVRLAGVELSIPEPRADGSAPAGSEAPDPASRAVAGLSAAADRLRETPCPIPPVDGERVVLTLTSAAAPPRRALELDAVSFRCGVLSGGGAWEASGRALLADDAAAPFNFSLAVSSDEVDAKLSLAPLPLGPLLAAFRQPRELEGRAQAELSWRSRPGAPHALRLALAGRDVRGELGRARDPQRALHLDMREPKLALALEASAGELRTTQLELADGAVAASGSLALGLPLSDASKLHASARTAGIGRDELARVAAQLPRGARTQVQRALERVVGGEVERLELRLNGTIGVARAMAAGEVLAHSGDLALKLSLANAEILIGKADRLADVSGTVEFAGDLLEIHASGAQFRDRRLPRLALKLRGISRVRSLDALQCDRPAPVPRIAAIDDVRAWIESRRRPPYTPTWRAITLDVDRLSHPLLFCTLEDVAAEILRLDNGYEYAVESGIWAGLAVEGQATWLKTRGQDGQPLRDGGSLSVDVTLGEPRPAAAPAADPEVWAEGRFAYDVTSLGRFLTKGYEGSFRARGSRAELYDTQLHLAPTGDLEGNLALEMGSDGPVPFTVEVQARSLDLLAVWQTSQAPKTLMSGRLSGAAVLSGHLLLGESPLTDVNGYASLHARKGEIFRDVPFLLALAMTDEKINPFGKRDRLPYKAIDLEGPIENGWMTSRTLTLEGKSERMAASGKTHLAEPFELEAAIGMYPIPTIDEIVGAIPIVNVLLLGEDRALAGFYFTVTGLWTRPVVEPLLAKSVASGPASLVLEGVPNFVFGSLKAIGDVLSPPVPVPVKEDPAEAPPPVVPLVQGPGVPEPS
jgi:hypothetical protein